MLEYYVQSKNGQLVHIKILKLGSITLDAILDLLNIVDYRFIDKQQFFVPDFEITKQNDETGKTKIAELTHKKS